MLGCFDSLTSLALSVQVVDVLLPACNGQSAAAAVRLLQLLVGRMGGNATAAAVDVGGEATCVPAAAVQLPTAAAINSDLFCGFPQVLIKSMATSLDTMQQHVAQSVNPFLQPPRRNTHGRLHVSQHVALDIKKLSGDCVLYIRRSATRLCPQRRTATCTRTTSATQLGAASACQCGTTTRTT